MSHYNACQIKFAFHVETESPLAWPEYFGFEDDFDMFDAYCKEYLNSETLEFTEIDGSGASLTVVFETSCDPADFQRDYNQALALLNKLSESPEYSKDVNTFNQKLAELEEEGITIYEGEPDSRVFEEWNLLVHGFKNYKDRITHINKTKSAA